MDDAQQNHLKAYGLTYNAIKAGASAEWLLNYRGGSFLLADTPELAASGGARRHHASSRSTTASSGRFAREIAANNMEAVPLEKAPKVAVYTPTEALPWDDAVTLALKYAGIEYTSIYDDEVEKGDLSKYDWLHLHHEDFTGQLNKFYLTLSRRAVVHRPAAEEHGGGEAARLRQHAGAQEGRRREDSRVRGARRISLRDVRRDGDARAGDRRARTSTSRRASSTARRWIPTPTARWTGSRTLAFHDAHLEQSPFVNSMSDIDGHQVNVPGRRQPLGTFTLFNFSAKFDPVPSMLVQNHRAVINDFYGVTTSFNKAVLKPGDVVLANEEGAPWVKYIHGDYGKGTWTYYGGHDPEDPQHAIGNPPTDLSLFKNSPGYRLILNNVLFPAAKKKPLKT